MFEGIRKLRHRQWTFKVPGASVTFLKYVDPNTVILTSTDLINVLSCKVIIYIERFNRVLSFKNAFSVSLIQFLFIFF